MYVSILLSSSVTDKAIICKSVAKGTIIPPTYCNFEFLHVQLPPSHSGDVARYDQAMEEVPNTSGRKSHIQKQDTKVARIVLACTNAILKGCKNSEH